MAEKTVLISQQIYKPIKILKWKVCEGNSMSIGRVILLYDFPGAVKTEQRKLKSTQAGTVNKIIAPEGAIVNPGESLFELKECIHPTVMKDMCAECGADLRKNETTTSASIPMVHAIPELKVNEELARKLGKADGDRLLRDRKLVLLVDLDQTLIHTTNDNIPPNIKDVYHFQLYGPNSPWYHTRLRPGTHKFLDNISPYFELHICTFGARNYAHTITMFLDNDQNYFSNRILSRDECFDPTSKKANLKALFPCGDNMVCIIDDREDVWNHASNLIHVKPYHFFQHTGDINAPPGLDKHEDDDKEGVDLSKIKVKVKKLNGKNVKSDKSAMQTLRNGATETSGNTTDDDKNKTMGIEKVETVMIENEVATGKNEGDEGTVKQTEAVKNENDIPSDQNEVTAKESEDAAKETEIAAKETEIAAKESEVAVKETEVAAKEYEATAKESEVVVKETEVAVKETEVAVKETKVAVKENEVAVKENEILLRKNEGRSNNTVKNDVSEKKDDDLIEIEDPDDYLFYLEDILIRIHKSFYEEFDKMESGEVPDLKRVIPTVRNQILKGCHLVFSGLVPTHIKLEHSKAYLVARSLGAVVTQDIEDDTTHLVAVRPGTAKVNAGRRKKNLNIVTPDWLWCCAERWEHVEEAIYPLSGKGSKNRHPPPHCSSPEHVPNYPVHDAPVMRKRTPSGRFMDTINPLMSFSSDDIADMDKEVEDILDDETDESEDETHKKKAKIVSKIIKKDESSSSSEESLTSEYPRGFKRTREKCKQVLTEEDLLESSLDEFPSTKFRRGEKIDSDLEIGQESNSEGSIEAPDEVDDGEWNMMGAALEREFLSNN